MHFTLDTNNTHWRHIRDDTNILYIYIYIYIKHIQQMVPTHCIHYKHTMNVTLKCTHIRHTYSVHHSQVIYKDPVHIYST